MNQNFNDIKDEMTRLYDTSGVGKSTSEMLVKTLSIYSEQIAALENKLQVSKEFCEKLLTRLEENGVDLAEKQKAEQNIDILNKKVAILEGQKAELNIAISQKESQIINLQQQLSSKDAELSKVRGDVTILQDAKDRFALIDLSPFYAKLLPVVKSSLSNTFPNDNAIGLLTAGVQLSNLQQLHTFLFNRLKEGKTENYIELLTIVRRLFDFYNEGQKEPFILIEPVPGDRLDSEQHITRGMGSTISNVLLFGYKTAKGTVKAKAFVEVL